MTLWFYLAFIIILTTFLSWTRRSTCTYVIIMFSIKLSATIHYSTASSSSCQVYPSEYAYRDDSVTRAESPNANCSSYPPREDYIHCDGTQLKLADSNIGQELYRSTDYYQWSAGSAGKLLFIFPTRVSLTTITLHYYSDSV